MVRPRSNITSIPQAKMAHIQRIIPTESDHPTCGPSFSSNHACKFDAWGGQPATDGSSSLMFDMPSEAAPSKALLAGVVSDLQAFGTIDADSMDCDILPDESMAIDSESLSQPTEIDMDVVDDDYTQMTIDEISPSPFVASGYPAFSENPVALQPSPLASHWDLNDSLSLFRQELIASVDQTLQRFSLSSPASPSVEWGSIQRSPDIVQSMVPPATAASEHIVPDIQSLGFGGYEIEVASSGIHELDTFSQFGAPEGALKFSKEYDLLTPATPVTQTEAEILCPYTESTDSIINLHSLDSVDLLGLNLMEPTHSISWTKKTAQSSDVWTDITELQQSLADDPVYGVPYDFYFNVPPIVVQDVAALFDPLFFVALDDAPLLQSNVGVDNVADVNSGIWDLDCRLTGDLNAARFPRPLHSHHISSHEPNRSSPLNCSTALVGVSKENVPPTTTASQLCETLSELTLKDIKPTTSSATSTVDLRISRVPKISSAFAAHSASKDKTPDRKIQAAKWNGVTAPALRFASGRPPQSRSSEPSIPEGKAESESQTNSPSSSMPSKSASLDMHDAQKLSAMPLSSVIEENTSSKKLPLPSGCSVPLPAPQPQDKFELLSMETEGVSKEDSVSSSIADPGSIRMRRAYITMKQERLRFTAPSTSVLCSPRCRRPSQAKRAPKRAGRYLRFKYHLKLNATSAISARLSLRGSLNAPLTTSCVGCLHDARRQRALDAVHSEWIVTEGTNLKVLPGAFPSTDYHKNIAPASTLSSIPKPSWFQRFTLSIFGW